MPTAVLSAEELVGGSASGKVLYADVGLSFWGGVDPLTGDVIDHTHPLHKLNVAGRILAIPNGRGSSLPLCLVPPLLLLLLPPIAVV